MSTPLVFRIYKNEQIYVVKQFLNEERIVFGSGGSANVDLQSDEVSSIHCLVEKRDSGFYICDLGSDQGTYLKGVQVLDQEINSGDHFEIGPYTVYFFVGGPKGAEAGTASKANPESMPESNTPAGPQSTQQQITGVAVTSHSAPPPQPAPKKSPAPLQSKPKVVQPAGKAKALRDFVKPGSGTQVEVLVSWQERIVNTYHFSFAGVRTAGPGSEINLPEGAVPAGWKLFNFTGSQIEIALSNDMLAEVLREGEYIQISDSRVTIKATDVCFISLANGMQLAIRFAPRAPMLIFDSPFVLGVTEFAGVLAALILAAVTSLIVAVNRPPPPEEELQDIQRLAKVVFNPPIKKVELTEPPPEVEKIPETPPEPPKPKIEKVNLADKKQEAKNPGDANNQAAKSQKANSGKAAEVAPKDPNLKKKMFTSTKQGGAIKTGETNGANAKSKEPDLKKSGLLAAFGSGGARNKLDKAYSGSGELLGAGERATGTSGFNTNRAGDDLGSRAKDTGAGGSGTATQGIAGVGTQGRGTGMAGLGSGSGFGEKGKVQISAGGNEEEFTGTIDREAVRRVVKSALAQFKACYEREYRMNSRLEGKVVVQWEIHEQGIAKNAKIVRVKSTINNAAVEECVKNRMLALKFPEPPPGTAAEVTYPFIFQGQKL